jgi:hypothetical protein
MRISLTSLASSVLDEQLDVKAEVAFKEMNETVGFVYLLIF